MSTEKIKIDRAYPPRSRIGLGALVIIKKRAEDEGCSFGKAVEMMAEESRGGLNNKMFHCTGGKSTMMIPLPYSKMSVSLINEMKELSKIMKISFGKALELMISGSCKKPSVSNKNKIIDRAKSKYARNYLPKAVVLPEVVDVLDEWIKEEDIPVGRAIDRMALESATFNKYFEKLKRDPDWVYE